jgi:2-iminoacetate synthase
VDYASPKTLAMGNALIDNEIGVVPNAKLRALVAKQLTAIEGGSRDFRI